MFENENTSSDSFNSPLINYISLLKKSLNKIHRPILNKIHRPILKSFKPSHKRKPINNLNFDFLKDPNHFYWEEQSSIYKMKPFDLFNLILKSKFNLSDKIFTEENDFLLIKSVEEGKKWLEIGIKIGKHPFLCIKRFIKLNKNKNNWTQLEDKILLKTVEKEKDWLKISMALENKTLKQCKDRYKKIVKIYKKGKWTKEEDEILKEVCDKFEDKNWVFISTFIPNRSDVQCRERWMNTLKPGLKLGKWSEDEDKKLIEIVKEKGKKWSIVSEIMGSRTDSQCRKRYMILKKKKIVIE